MYEPVATIPDAGKFGGIDPLFAAPESAFHSARARAHAAMAAVRFRLEGEPALVVRGRFERLAPLVRRAELGEKRSLWSVAVSAVWDTGAEESAR